MGLDQGYFGNYKEMRNKYSDAVFYAVARYQFRSKEMNNQFIWLSELAPSRQLHADYKKTKKITWKEYVPRFLTEWIIPNLKRLF